MKTGLLFSFIATVFLFAAMACSECQQESDKGNEIARIENLLERYLIASENKDFHAIGNIWADGDSIMLFGTDSHEKLMGWDAIRNAFRRQFNLIDDTYISVSDQYIKINCTGNTAWFAQTLNYNFMYKDIAHSFEGLRFTGVLEIQENGEWKMVQGHLSVPANLNIGK
jgi:ketosteroid isomerase-like protein